MITLALQFYIFRVNVEIVQNCKDGINISRLLGTRVSMELNLET